MGKITTYNINKFYGGISDDVRDQSNGVYANAKHFDIFSDVSQLLPIKSLETDNVISTTSTSITSFTVDQFAYLGANQPLYGFGQTNSKLRILQKAASDIILTSKWTFAATSSQSGNGLPVTVSGIYFKDYLWGLKGSSSGTANKAEVFQYGRISTGTRALSESYSSTNSLTIDDTLLSRSAPSIIGVDDDLYMFYENKVAKIKWNSGTSFTLTANRLQLPVSETITCAAKYQNYLAIGTKPINSGASPSMLYLWNYTSDDVSEAVEWSDGDLETMGNVGGTLIGLTQAGSASAASSEIRTWAGGRTHLLKRVPYTNNQTSYTGFYNVVSKVYRDKFYVPLVENSNAMLWAVGKANASAPWAVTPEILVNGSTNASKIAGFVFVGDYVFASFYNGSALAIAKTDDAGLRAHNSLYVSQKFNGGDVTKKKQLLSCAVGYSALPSGATVTLEYRTDYDTTRAFDLGWTTIFTDSVLYSTSHEAMNVESAGTVLPSNFTEIQFRVTSTGNAKISALKCRLEELASQIN